MSTTTKTLCFAPGQFFGGARLTCSGRGIDISHRIADVPPEGVLTHTHEDAHFILVTGGDYVSAAGRRPAADHPLLIYNPPGVTHRDYFDRGRGSFFAISLSPDRAAAAFEGMSAPDYPLYLLETTQHTLAMSIAGFCTQQAPDLSLESLCLLLLGTLDRRANRSSGAQPRWLHSALELLQDRYDENLTIADIARCVGVHPIHLARTFRRHFRCTPGEFSRFRRLEKAIGLLVRTSWPLTDVALASGFADHSHFSKAFVQWFGLPPGEYRSLAGSSSVAARRFQIDKTRFSRWAKVTEWATAARASARRRK
jgi:AraC family transcriptional regulator